MLELLLYVYLISVAVHFVCNCTGMLIATLLRAPDLRTALFVMVVFPIGYAIMSWFWPLMAMWNALAIALTKAAKYLNNLKFRRELQASDESYAKLLRAIDEISKRSKDARKDESPQTT